MFASLRALLNGVIDYAGLFPPAQLSLDQAIRNYARYRQEADAWMLGRFVIPAARLAELEPYHELFLSEGPISAAVLCRGGATGEEVCLGFGNDMRDVAACNSDRVKVDVFEVRLPAYTAEPVAELAVKPYFPAVQFPPYSAEPLAEKSRLDPYELMCIFSLNCLFRIFCEAPIESLPNLTQALRKDHLGFKLRCGGSDASAFPSSEHAALVLRACLDAGVPFKATAGLHHPLPHFNASLNVRMHGFINLFLAGVLAHARNLGIEQIRAILDDDRPEHFVFDDEGANWRDVRASTVEIAAARQQFMISFGSCSFDEPRADLRALGWL